MIQKLAVLSGLIISVTCTGIHPVPVVLQIQPEYSDLNYNFAYDVNDLHTGDVKSQQETRRGDVVAGQYSLIQPDGVRRTVDYRADDHRGFRATVNNDGRPVNQNLLRDNAQAQSSVDINVDHVTQRYRAQPQPWQSTITTNAIPELPRLGQNTQDRLPNNLQWPIGNIQAPVATSRTSIVQTISNNHPSIAQNPWK